MSDMMGRVTDAVYRAFGGDIRSRETCGYVARAVLMTIREADSSMLERGVSVAMRSAGSDIDAIDLTGMIHAAMIDDILLPT